MNWQKIKKALYNYFEKLVGFIELASWITLVAWMIIMPVGIFSITACAPPLEKVTSELILVEHKRGSKFYTIHTGHGSNSWYLTSIVVKTDSSIPKDKPSCIVILNKRGGRPLSNRTITLKFNNVKEARKAMAYNPTDSVNASIEGDSNSVAVSRTTNNNSSCFISTVMSYD